MRVDYIYTDVHFEIMAGSCFEKWVVNNTSTLLTLLLFDVVAGI